MEILVGFLSVPIAVQTALESCIGGYRRALAFHRGEKAYGFQLILAALSLMAVPTRSV
jgi:hypothetical protein